MERRLWQLYVERRPLARALVSPGVHKLSGIPLPRYTGATPLWRAVRAWQGRRWRGGCRSACLFSRLTYPFLPPLCDCVCALLQAPVPLNGVVVKCEHKMRCWFLAYAQGVAAVSRREFKRDKFNWIHSPDTREERGGDMSMPPSRALSACSSDG